MRYIKSYNFYDYNNSYQNLYTYSGLNMGILSDWFEEMYTAHGNGITLRRDTPQTEKSKDPRELSQCTQRVSQFIDNHMDESFKILSDDSKTMEEQNQAFIQFLMGHKEELRPSSIDATVDQLTQDNNQQPAGYLPTPAQMKIVIIRTLHLGNGFQENCKIKSIK